MLNDNQLNSFEKDGYAILDFTDLSALDKLQSLFKKTFPIEPEKWHTKDVTLDEHLALVHSLRTQVQETGFVIDLLKQNIGALIQVLGPDLDTQPNPQVRVSRPHKESDLIDWHRDTFYGNSAWELNLWFPIFELSTGAGFMVIPGTHSKPSVNIREIADSDSFRKTVTKGSLANKVGYTYSAKTDDLVTNADFSKAVMLTPKVGQAVFFFTSIIHRAQNHSNSTRISIDTHVKQMHAPTNTKEGYFVPLHRGVVGRSMSRFYSNALY